MEALAQYQEQHRGRLAPRTAAVLIASMIGAIAGADICLARYFNLGVLYMIPFIMATQYVRRSRRLLLLAIGLVLLNYCGLLSANMQAARPDEFLKFRLINRGFVAISLTGTALLLVFYQRIRDYWLRRQAEMAPTDGEVSLLLQVFQMFEDVTAVIVAIAMAAMTFAIDYFTSRLINVPILYLVSLAVIALTRTVWLLWSTAALLLALAYAGYFCGPAPADVAADILRRSAINRELAASAIVVAAALFHLTARPRGKKIRAH